jgi:hypothetical protein
LLPKSSFFTLILLLGNWWSKIWEAIFDINLQMQVIE